ncbi:hypothetical protein PENNAL_c0491G06474 [Penicillium nalgiovense]|uniref:Uncharacterized protein n=1 Tax=Penicillium nalgiovense TaxID=60175 RepID=A0A1V6VP05_PENNA|nr:hypothetical protein PENNAL_c0491G06474 [Penicillium nalgiovense]
MPKIGSSSRISSAALRMPPCLRAS